MKKIAVIMAGGKGERFWPKSRGALPKQFLSFTKDKLTMIQMTAKRLLPLVSYQDMFVVTNKNYAELVQKQLPEIPRENILAEPFARNTAPAVGFAAEIIRRKCSDALMMVLASDHLIKDDRAYIDTMLSALKAAEEGENLVTIGISPTYPETGYGYIHMGESAENFPEVYKVKGFAEKPDLETAGTYLASGGYLWNSGMFVWKVSSILKKFGEYLPEIKKGLELIGQAYETADFDGVLSREYEKFKAVSVDYGIMEKAGDIYTIPGAFGWDDVGSWAAAGRIDEPDESGNSIKGDVISIDTKNSVIVGGQRLLAVIGLENIVVVDSGDAVLICEKDRCQDIKKIIERLKAEGREELL